MVQAVHQGISFLVPSNMTGINGTSAILAFSFKFMSLSWKEPAESCAALEGPDRKELRDLVAATGKRLEDCQAFYEVHLSVTSLVSINTHYLDQDIPDGPSAAQ